MSFLHHILDAIWRRRITEFWPIWISMTVAAAIGVAWIVGRTSSSGPQKKTQPPSQHTWNWAAVAALMLLALMLTGYVADALKLENFADGDGHLFTHDTLQGHNMGLSLWPEQGRFFPFGHQEFNLIRHFTSSAAGYHAMPMVQIVIICCILLFLDDELSIAASAMLVAVVLILPGIVISFTELPVPDRNFVFWLVLLLFFLKRFERSQATAWAVAAAVCAQVMIYYKETACLLLLGFAGGRILLRCWRTDRFGFSLNRIRDKESRLDLCFIALSIVFLLYYFVAMMPHMSMKYANQQRLSLANTFLYYLRLDLLAWCFVATVVRRVYLILQHREAPDPFWDGLALGGVTCFAAYLYLRLASPYYLAPVDVIAVLYLGRLLILSWQKMPKRMTVAASALAFLVLLQFVSYSAFILFERKNTVYAKAKIADVIVSRYRSDPNAVQRIFFPFASAYELTEFASYLTYRGIPVESPQSPGLRDVALATKGDGVKDGPCVDYLPFVCHAANEPSAGDLVIELPDDDEPFAQMSPYQREGDLLFSYEPRPRLPMWLNPFASYLRLASVQFQRKPIPDRWLHASVTEAK